MEQFRRSAMLLKEENIKILGTKKVAVFGIGGVGSFTVEALARTGVGHFLLVDNDTIAVSNINRQLHATYETIGKYKTKVMAERILSINPKAVVETLELFCLPENILNLLDESIDYVVDAIDTVSTKLALVEECYKRQVPVVSAMGAGNKLDPTKFVIADIYQTTTCPLCRVMRKELRKREVGSLKVVYSTEEPLTPDDSFLSEEEKAQRRSTPGSVAFVPSVAGLIVAGEVIKDLIHTDS